MLASRPLAFSNFAVQQQGAGLRRVSSAPSLVVKAHNSSSGPSGLRPEGWSELQVARLGRALHSQSAAAQQQGENNATTMSSRSEAVAAGDQTQTLASRMAAESRFASLSRVLLVGQPGSMFRTLANRKWPSAVGPISLLVFLFGTVLALFAAVRGALVRKVKSCKCCKGFGVVRCRLCDGRGAVDWRAKFSYSEACPLCGAKRFVVCPDCGGHYHRRLFNHAKGNKGTLESFFPAAAAGVTTRSNALD
ncbi:hypothetical protein GPECTOR_5g207 [Gonium pectorale]|uniref:Uncharacterized protein n=1 Tax=Gonium pectorale TaxID=33097 RepID=A0A150GWB9_GONPE|nr:hypothetical protein GPECTOR_5g207 [Gonium pectorale]|eukprot:KXZ54104.1 hypothetical protein GPECTOR_5g207 [Gonium pectorale]